MKFQSSYIHISHFQDYLIQYISHQYQVYYSCYSFIVIVLNIFCLHITVSQHNDNNNVVLAMTMPFCGQG